MKTKDLSLLNVIDWTAPGGSTDNRFDFGYEVGEEETNRAFIRIFTRASIPMRRGRKNKTVYPIFLDRYEDAGTLSWNDELL